MQLKYTFQQTQPHFHARTLMHTLARAHTHGHMYMHACIKHIQEQVCARTHTHTTIQQRAVIWDRLFMNSDLGAESCQVRGGTVGLGWF